MNYRKMKRIYEMGAKREKGRVAGREKMGEVIA